MVDGKQVGHGDFRAAVDEGGGLEQLHDVLPATVADVDIAAQVGVLHLYACQSVANGCDAGKNIERQGYAAYLSLPFGILAVGDLPFAGSRFQMVGRIVQQHFVERFFLLDAGAENADEETVP